MKTRSDFVSNSSSSSFILKDAGFFETFGVTKKDLDEAITALYGADVLKERLASQIAVYERATAEALLHGDFDDAKRCSDEVGALKDKGLRYWEIYDMTDEKDRAECAARWGEHFSGWFSPQEGDFEKWSQFEEIMRWKCDFDNLEDVLKGKADELVAYRYRLNREERAFPGGADLVRYVKEKLEVKTMKEVMSDPDCTLVIHFADNVVMELAGMQDDDPASGFKSEPWTPERFFEVLIDRLVQDGKVDMSDPRLLEFWKVEDGDDWYAKKHPGKKTYLEDDSKADALEVCRDLLGYSAVMHEG